MDGTGSAADGMSNGTMGQWDGAGGGGSFGLRTISFRMKRMGRSLNAAPPGTRGTLFAPWRLAVDGASQWRNLKKGG